jgi:hypothetical protein
MPKIYIDQFMFPYQHTFRGGLEILARNVFKHLGADVSPKVFLVGARSPDSKEHHPVCIEPEDGEWSRAPFDELLAKIEATIRDHPMQRMFYGDEAAMRDKPENIRRNSVTESIGAALALSDETRAIRSFCGFSVRVGDYYVVPVIQIPESLFRQFPPLDMPASDDPRIPRGYPSVIHASIAELLAEAAAELQRPEPGRGALLSASRRAGEIVRIAASNFMRTPAYAIAKQYVPGELFDRFNLISSLMYEGLHGVGHLVLAKPDSATVEFLIRFKQPVPFRESRWARKILQMASADIALIADSEVIYGLGRIKATADDNAQGAFVIDFLDHFHWQLRRGQQVMLTARYGNATLAQESISRERFIENLSRLFPNSSAVARERLWTVFCTAVDVKHGSMIVVTSDAAQEARRLTQQGTSIEPTVLTPEVFKHVSGIDGTILVDVDGICHAVGVILDGIATPDCTPSRGSRFNSGVRYVHASNQPRLVIVVSDDRTIDVFPVLRPRINREDIERQLVMFEAATLDNYHKPRNWLDAHRFYLSKTQCERANAVLDRIEGLPKEVGVIYIHVSRFAHDEAMDDSYFLPAAPEVVEPGFR